MPERVVSIGYALCVAVVCACLAGRELAPSVDYPQHLAMARQLRDLLLGVGGGQLVPWTYNGLFEVAAGLLALVVPIGWSGRLVLAASLALTALAVWRLVRFSGRPPAYAFAWLPLAYSYPFSWGFINFVLGVALATLSLIAWLEKRSALTFVTLSLLTAVAHVLGAVVLGAGVVLGVLLRARDLRAGAQLLPLVVWVGVAHAFVDAPPHLPWADQTFWPTWAQRAQLAGTLTGSLHGPADEWLAAAVGGVALLGVAVGVRRAWRQRRPASRQPFSWLTLGAVVVYLAGPLAVLGCWSFYQRAGYLPSVWGPALLPRLPGRWRTAQGAFCVAVGVLATVNVLVQEGLGAEGQQARAIIDAVPAGAKVAPVLALAPGESLVEALRGVPSSDALVWAHFPASLVALRDAEIPWMFAREHGHFPLRLPVREGLELPSVDYGWSRAFHPSADYAREFDHVLVLTGRDGSILDPRDAVFGEAGADAIELSHQGRFRLYRYTPSSP